MKLALKNFNPLSFSLLAMLLVAVNGCAVDPASKDTPDKRTSVDGLMPYSAGFSGNFLAGRFAQKAQDWTAASHYMDAALSHDQNNSSMQQRAFLLAVGAGDNDRAAELADDVLKSAPNLEMALIYKAVDAMSRNDYKTVLDTAGKLPDNGFGQYTKPLLSAWALAGEGMTDDALKVLAHQTAPDEPTFDLHMALIEERAGRLEDADKHFRSAAGKGLTMQTALIAAKFYERHDEGAKARQIYETLGKTYPFNPFVTALPASKDTLSEAFVSPADGVAIGLFEIANALYDRRAFDSAQIYSQLVAKLNPQMPAAQLLIGDLAAIANKEDVAIQHYDAINPQSAIFWLAQMRMAEMLEANGKLAEAEALLINQSKSKPIENQALVSLGDFYRRTGQFNKAVKVYDDVLARTDAKDPNYWAVVYARGMSLERSDNWERAEKDLIAALDLQPENPMILNFIGYSWLEKGVNIEKALKYTSKAATLRPDDGYIMDSYGLALYRTRQFEQAAKVLERASQLVTDDPEILNHLGDAYWQVGRKMEAQFKWKRAIEMSTDAKLKATLARKMQDGIEQIPTAAQTAQQENKL